MYFISHFYGKKLVDTSNFSATKLYLVKQIIYKMQWFDYSYFCKVILSCIAFIYKNRAVESKLEHWWEFGLKFMIALSFQKLF